MLTSAHILRSQAEDIPGLVAPLSDRELERKNQILNGAARLMANNGPHAVNFSLFASSLRLAPNTLRRFFPNLEALLAEILSRHLNQIARAIGAIERSEPNWQSKRRAAYVTYTRTAMGNPTPAHLLLLRDRHSLPPDLFTPIEKTRHQIGTTLGGENWYDVLYLIDHPGFSPEEAENLITNLLTTRAQTQSECATTTPPAEIHTQPQGWPTQPTQKCSNIFDKITSAADRELARLGIPPRTRGPPSG